jgi:hypothetical protein
VTASIGKQIVDRELNQAKYKQKGENNICLK